MREAEYAAGDVVEVYNPQTESYQWIEVERVIEVKGARVLVAKGAYYCACLVNVDAVAMPENIAVVEKF
jgi:hypothetical protein